MNKVILIALVFGFFVLMDVSRGFGQEIVVERSPFARAEIVSWGRPFNDAWQDELRPDPKIEVRIHMVIKDMDQFVRLPEYVQRMYRNANGEMIAIPWSALNIVVNPDSKVQGTLISYKRDLDQNVLSAVTLTVSSENDMKLWLAKYEECYVFYMRSFREERNRYEAAKAVADAREAEKRKSLEKLRQNPIRVIPE